MEREFSSLTDGAISFSPFQVSTIQVQDCQTMAALVPKVERQRETWREGVCKAWVYRQISKTVLSLLGLAHKRLQNKRNFRRFVTVQTCGASFSLQPLIQSKLYPGLCHPNRLILVFLGELKASTVLYGGGGHQGG